jgi:hypothetical protein
MTLEMVIIAVARVLGSLPVLRWAFVGGVIAVLVDLSDLFMMNLIVLGGVTDYQQFDKALDQVYMLAFLVVALTWHGMPRRIALSLYAFRLVGLVVFLITASREVLLFFPNLFEFWFLFVAAMHHVRPGFRYTTRNVLIAAAALLAVKLTQEYVIHYAQLLDSFTAVEAVEAIWRFVTSPFR